MGQNGQYLPPWLLTECSGFHLDVLILTIYESKRASN